MKEAKERIPGEIRLSSKERLFCTYYCLGRNGREAAAKSGYHFPEKSAARLLKKKEVREQIIKNDSERKSKTDDIIAGYYRLAFGCITDAVKLILDNEIDETKLEEMDLFLISDIKKPKGGGIEIKFFDRLKALEKLEALVSKEADSNSCSLYSAIEKGAKALGNEDEE